MFGLLIIGLAIGILVSLGREIQEKYGDTAASYYTMTVLSAVFAVSSYMFKYISSFFNNISSSPGTLGAVAMNYQKAIGGTNLWYDIVAVIFLISFFWFSFLLMKEMSSKKKADG